MANDNTATQALDESLKLRPPAELKELRGLTVAFLERARRRGGGPRFFKTGSGRTAKVYYRLADVDAWVESHLADSSSQSWGPAKKGAEDKAEAA